ncbi:hypothetical protein PITC_021010 [Penicillium italicum]|uniref:Uncharacterized protein n=1 Tax=Penicillium italicum TaxID=40296 RepID=A0A0A2KR26_PENIT|nr:hypothetical protein PITC_021010 [Penicillium italicum]
MSLDQDAPQLKPSEKALKRSFEEMFDPDRRGICTNDHRIDTNDCGIDFTENSPDTTTILSTPQPTDRLVQTYKKLKRLADLVHQGKSLAIHTNYTKAPKKERDPIAEAKKKMRSTEINQYDAWVAGTTMPTVDWEHSHKAVKLPEDKQAHFKQQVRAIRKIYDNSHITRTNTHWFMSNFPYVLPLIEAIVIVRAVRQQYVRDQEGTTERELIHRKDFTEMELAELETARGIIGVTTDILRKRERRVELDDTLPEIHPNLEFVMDLTREACGVIQFRVNMIHEKAMQYKEERKGMGFPRAKE